MRLSKTITEEASHRMDTERTGSANQCHHLLLPSITMEIRCRMEDNLLLDRCHTGCKAHLALGSSQVTPTECLCRPTEASSPGLVHLQWACRPTTSPAVMRLTTGHHRCLPSWDLQLRKKSNSNNIRLNSLRFKAPLKPSRPKVKRAPSTNRRHKLRSHNRTKFKN